MAVRTLSLLFLVPVCADFLEARPANPPAAVNAVNSTWSNFVYCKCGHTCAKQVGSWYVFDLYQSCACAPCDEEKAEAAEASAVMPATEEKPEKTEKSLKAMDKEGSWDAASLLGSNVLYCPCGPGCAYGRQLGMTTYYCFRYGCRPCYR